MGNRGFNEKELRKTIVTKIDKDGFNKKEVFDGDVGSSDFTFATMTIADGSGTVSMYVNTFEEATDEYPARLESYYGSFNAGDIVKLPLYKGLAIAHMDPHNMHSSDLSVVGDAEILEDDVILAVKIHGDFSIAYSGR